LIHSAWNNSRSKSLGGEAAITVFLGLPAHNPINLIFDSVNDKMRETTKTREEILGMATHLQKTLEEMHKNVKESSKKERGRKKISQLKLSDFEIGDSFWHIQTRSLERAN